MAEEFRLVIQVLEDFGKNTVARLRESSDRKGVGASGNMRQALDYYVLKTVDFTNFRLNFTDGYKYKAPYAAQVDKGRGATIKKGGNGAVYRSITGGKGWISQKGIAPPMTITYKKKTKQGIKIVAKTFKDINEANRSLAFLIARKIHREGFKASHFYSEVVTPQLLDDIKTDIRDAFKRDIIITLKAN